MHPTKIIITPRPTVPNRLISLSTLDTQPPRTASFRLHRPTKQLKPVPLMNDDYRDRQPTQSQTFIMGNSNKGKVMTCQIAFTQRFCYVTLYEMGKKTDKEYKIRLIGETGKKIMQRFHACGYKFRDQISRDETGRYYLSAPFPPFYRNNGSETERKLLPITSSIAKNIKIELNTETGQNIADLQYQITKTITKQAYLHTA